MFKQSSGDLKLDVKYNCAYLVASADGTTEIMSPMTGAGKHAFAGKRGKTSNQWQARRQPREKV